MAEKIKPEQDKEKSVRVPSRMGHGELKIEGPVQLGSRIPKEPEQVQPKKESSGE